MSGDIGLEDPVIFYSEELTITVTPDAETDLGNGGGTALILTFTDLDGTTPQTVTVTAVDDTDIEGPHPSTISFVVSSTDLDYDGTALSNIIVDVTDDDVVVSALVPSEWTRSHVQS